MKSQKNSKKSSVCLKLLRICMPWLSQRIVFDIDQSGYDGSAFLPGRIILKRKALEVLVNHPADAAVDYIRFMAAHEAGHQANDQNYRQYNRFSGTYPLNGILLDFKEGLGVCGKEIFSRKLREEHSMMDRMDEICADMHGFAVALGGDIDRLDCALAWRRSV